ncbi:hypothetical protein NDU88_009398 [Pleurodeles waltl]|uniref:Uncharacterized protein n=1 Tax=Pleurodeles waltl TaxID=8319 RepID=A0AAV7QUH2_PLEWA|nr:hypothetical protein NDU88_009398 [Pleurodeles waltl]
MKAIRGEREKGPDEAYAWAYICHTARLPTAEEASVLHRYQCIKRQSPIALQGRRREQPSEERHTQSGQETHLSAAQRGLRIQTERWRVDAG